MSTTPALFDPDALRKRVAEQIQATFGSLIPDDVFTEMCNKAVNEFFTNKSLFEVSKTQEPVGGNSWHTSYRDVYSLSYKCTPFERMVFETVHKLLGQRLDTFMTEQRDLLEQGLDKMLNESMPLKAALADNLMAMMQQVGQRQLADTVSMSIQGLKHTISSAFYGSGQPDIASKIMNGG